MASPGRTRPIEEMPYQDDPSIPLQKKGRLSRIFGSDDKTILPRPAWSRRNDDETTALEAESLETGVVPPRRRKKRWQGYFICGSIWMLTIFVVFFFIDIVLAICRNIWRLDANPDAIFAKWGQPGTGTEGLSWYPTDFLRDVQPIACHSHNDYWRTVPLFSALHAGCIGTEADVWLFENDTKLYVGHDTAALTPNRTFQSLYIDPLYQILNGTNPRTQFFNGTDTKNGVFDVNRDQSLTLLVDVKTNGTTTWPHVLEQLEPLRARGWLTYVENGVLHNGPITVVGTGNTPFDLVIQNSTYRDAFFDAPLGTMWEDPDLNDSDSSGSFTYNSTNSEYASISFGAAVGRVWLGLSQDQLRTIRGQVKGAHSRGLKARYWDLPAWPLGLRNAIWHALVTEGVDMLNVDDIYSASKLAW